MLKSTMQDLADAVGVSRITVWKALNDREGVSPRTKKRIQQKAAEMGLTDTEIQMEKTPEKETGRDEAEERTFSVVVSRPESSAFWMQIIHHIAKELARSRINLMYTYMPSFYSEGYTLPASVKNVDGLIVLNIYDARLLHMLNELPLPKVFLDTVPGMHPPALHGDLVLIEGRTCIREITRRLIDSGRTRLGFVGDVGYATPTVMFHVATACLGNVGHSWQNTAFACSDIGMKGMLRAAEIMTLAAIRTMDQPEVIAKAREELKQKNGGSYHCPLPDYVTPPIGRY